MLTLDWFFRCTYLHSQHASWFFFVWWRGTGVVWRVRQINQVRFMLSAATTLNYTGRDVVGANVERANANERQVRDAAPRPWSQVWISFRDKWNLTAQSPGCFNWLNLARAWRMLWAVMSSIITPWRYLELEREKAWNRTKSFDHYSLFPTIPAYLALLPLPHCSLLPVLFHKPLLSPLTFILTNYTNMPRTIAKKSMVETTKRAIFFLQYFHVSTTL